MNLALGWGAVSSNQGQGLPPCCYKFRRHNVNPMPRFLNPRAKTKVARIREPELKSPDKP